MAGNNRAGVGAWRPQGGKVEGLIMSTWGVELGLSPGSGMATAWRDLGDLRTLQAPHGPLGGGVSAPAHGSAPL